MKTNEQTRLIFVFCVLFIFIQLTQTSFSQWLPEQRLTNSNGSSVGNSNNSKWITVSDNFVHVVWTDDRNGKPAVFYKRSSDHGATWSNDLKINNTDSTANYPAITSSGQFVHIVWRDDRNDTTNIYYVYSSNSGSSWSTNTLLSPNKTGIGMSISCENEHVIVCWTDTRFGNGQVYLKTSSNNGQSWNDEFRIMNPSMTAQYPSVCQSGSNVHIAWNIQYPSYQVRYIKSTDYGLTWGDQEILVTAGIPWIPSISVSGNDVHLAYMIQTAATQYNNFYKRSTDNGVTWSSGTAITTSNGAMGPYIQSYGSVIHYVWRDHRAIDNGIYYRISTDNGINWANELKLSGSGEQAENPCISVSNSALHVVWNDPRVGNNEIYYRRNLTGNGPYSVSGLVTLQDNNQPVTGGYVKAIKYESSTSKIITVDSTGINPNGTYTLPHVPSESLDLMFYQDDDMLQFVPTYYVSTIDWREATQITPTTNLTNINCQVYRINNTTNPFNISGQVTANIDNPYVTHIKDAIIYVKSGSFFKNYGISNGSGSYIATKLPSGSYELITYRMGFAPVSQNVTITNSSLNNINFDLGNPLIGIDPIVGTIAEEYSLSQNYPNPFNPTTTMKFALPLSEIVRLSIYDILGREIETLVNEKLAAGSYSVNWDASGYPSGLYFYRLESDNFTETRKMVLIK
ncbi:MAG: exo-alpha-sialidase [Ignavibacteria bacterium]|nr:exo-alpha-sialidase [Ignavibacteria bacterium]